MLIDYHVHVERAGPSRENMMRFVRQAQSVGVDEIAFTEHAYNFVELAPLLPRPSFLADHGHGFELDDYLTLVGQVADELKEQGAPITVRTGLEVDFLPEMHHELGKILPGLEVDLIIGSVHWIDDWGFDLGKSTWDGRDSEQACTRYFEIAAEAARSGLFSVIGHPDIIKIYGLTADERCRAATSRGAGVLVKAAAASGACLEVSSAGLRRPVGEIYPSMEILRMARHHDVGITMASDAHEPHEVGKDLGEVAKWARRAGYDEITRFSRRRKIQSAL